MTIGVGRQGGRFEVNGLGHIVITICEKKLSHPCHILDLKTYGSQLAKCHGSVVQMFLYVHICIHTQG